jgi:hypothetical protein
MAKAGRPPKYNHDSIEELLRLGIPSCEIAKQLLCPQGVVKYVANARGLTEALTYVMAARTPKGRRCAGPCSQWFPWREFPPLDRTASRRSSHCRTCYNRRQSIQTGLVSKFHIGHDIESAIAKYDSMVKIQRGTCALRCGVREDPHWSLTGTGRLLVPDHDHLCCPGTGPSRHGPVQGSCGDCIRALLCFAHNTHKPKEIDLEGQALWRRYETHFRNGGSLAQWMVKVSG